MNKFWILALALSLVLSAQGQISGTVYSLDTQGKKEPLPGVNLFWEGSETGTVSDSEGRYEIEVVPGHSTLVASFVGYKTEQKIIISRRGNTDFTLVPEGTELQMVTVKGEARATAVEVKAAALSFRIDDSELRKAACCNLSESFETNAAVDVSFSDAVSGTRQIEMLGLAGRYALIQRENIPLARGLNATSGLTYIPGPFIESIQLTKGLSSVINGYESLTGQINVEYYKPENAPRLLLNVFGNQGGRSEVNLAAGGRYNQWADHLTMVHFSTIPIAQDRNQDGFADIPNGYQANLTHRSHWRSENGWEGQLGINLVQDQKRGGEMAFVREEASEAKLWGFAADHQRLELYGKTGYVFEKPNRSLGFIYSYSRQKRDERFGQRHYVGEQNSFYFNSIYQDQLGDSRHLLRTGFSFLLDEVRENLRHESSTPLYFQERLEIVPGAYAEYSFDPHENFSLVAGARVDYHQFFESLWWSPRLHLRYALNSRSTFRLAGGRGQRTPNAVGDNSGLMASSRILSLPNEVLPEIGWNSGFSYDQLIPLGDRSLRFTTDIFYTWFENKLVADLDRDPLLAVLINARGSRSLSAMAQLDYEIIPKLEGRLAYKYLQAEEQFSQGLALAYQIPRHRSFLNLAYSGIKDWKLDATLNWFGAKRQPPTSLAPEAFRREAFSPDFFTVNMQVNREWKNFDFFVGVDNLLDFRQKNPIANSDNPFAPYFDSNFVWGPIFGRMIYAGLYLKLERQ